MIAAVVLAAIIAAYFLMSKTTPEKKATPAPVAEEVKNAPKEAIQPEKVIVYTAPAKKKLGLSKAVIDAPEKHVIEAVEVPASEHDVTAVVVVDSTTGETSTELQEQPLPWFKPETHHDIGIDYVVKRGMVTIPSLSYRVEFVKMKEALLLCFGSLDIDREGRAGCGAHIRF